ncbi:DNA translocase FtsK [Chloroflexota bacterium]
MAKQKFNNKDKDKNNRKVRKASFWAGLSRVLTSPWTWRFVFLIAIASVLWWQWEQLLLWVAGVTGSTVDLFGWGLVLIALIIIIIMGMIWRRQLADWANRWKLYLWNRWLGAASFTLASWGTLALFDLGGSFGLRIINNSFGLIGIFRVLVLIFLGLILVAPRFCCRFLGRFTLWLARIIKWGISSIRISSPVRAPVSRRREVVIPHPVEKEETEKIAPIPVPEVTATALDPQQELRQVAQDVWKKYGESDALVTADGWRLPPIDILDKASEIEFGEADNVERSRLIEEALSSYGVDAKVVQINAGPTVTQFGVEPGWDRKTRQVREKNRDGEIELKTEEVSRTRVKVDRITSLANDMALALAAPSIRIEAPVPGKSIVGIEVPNVVSTSVNLRGVIETSTFQKIVARSKLSLALGKGAGGEAVSDDLAKMPHLLIAGATGSGKTVCLNAIICCLLLSNSPQDVQFIMVDPKRVELTPFNSIPHLATPVIVDADKAVGTLRWLNQEMDKRYQQLATAGARNIAAYNKNREGADKLPYLVLVIDELADLMMTGFDEVEHILCRLAQLARAIGIHLIVATQRPSVDVVTGLIKANFPTRISFAVTSQVDSRTILDSVGAEKLLGRGDMLYMPTDAGKPKRLQGCYVSDAEIERLVYFWGSQHQEGESHLKIKDLTLPSAVAKKDSASRDSLMEVARQLREEHSNISTSYLQRKLHIGYPRAARIMEDLKEEDEPFDDGGAEVPD